MIRRGLRRVWKLPEKRCRSQIEPDWISMRDGVRLSTVHIWPIDAEGETPTILIRSPYGINKGRSLLGVAGRLIAESGYHVVLQDVRGRYASEGRFEPFLNEREDGLDTLDWIERQNWHGGKVGLWGASYIAYTAWSILSEAPDRIDAMISAIGSHRLYDVFYRGGALTLQNAFEWGLTVGTQQSVPQRQIDLERGMQHRPLCEGDRVALREVSWLREWIKRNRQDEYWDTIDLPLPTTLPPTLLIAGWYDFFLGAQLEDFQSLNALARETQSPAPHLVIGPWCHGLPARAGWWRHELSGFLLQKSILYLDQHLKEGEGSKQEAPVRYFSAGDDHWHSSSTWPPAHLKSHCFHLRSHSGEGTLENEVSSGEEESMLFTYDPEQSHKTLGGALFGGKAGIKDQRQATNSPQHQATYTSKPLSFELPLVGAVRLEISYSTDAEDADLFAQLLDVFPDGRIENVSEAMQRSRWYGVPTHETQARYLKPGEIRQLCLEFVHTARTIRTGHCLRLVIAGGNFPTYDRNPGTTESPALARADAFRTGQHQIHHGAGLDPRLTLSLRA